ncbi:MAG: sensor histidine kinase [Bacillota bacterium]
MPMKSSARVGLLWKATRNGWAVLWPSLTAKDSDSESHRSKTVAVRGAQLAMVAMVAVAIASALLNGAHKLSWLRLVSLVLAGMTYVIWTHHGSQDAVRFALWHHGASSPPPWPRPGRLRPIIHLVVQFILAEVIVWLAGPSRIVGLLWLVLLPPIGQSIMFFHWPGIATVSVLSVALHTFNVAWWHGETYVPLALLGFGMAVLFTLAFTQITVSAEKARGEVERLATELSEANGKLREYALQAEELAATRERNRVAREIHDSVGHCLTVVHVQLEAARTTFDRDPAYALEALGKAQKVAQAGLQDIRRSVAALRVSPLHNRPLVDAIGQLASENQAAGLATEVGVLGQARALSPQVELTFYRAAQEGLTNCRKHSQANSARVLLDFQKDKVVRLVVSDQGVGASDTTCGFGLLGLRERAQLLGGQVRVQTTPGNGFVLEVEVPG